MSLLEEIKKTDLSWVVNHLNDETKFDGDRLKKYFDWLIKQAEIVEDLIEINQRLEKKNEMILGWNTEHVLELQELKKQNEHIKG